MAAYTIRAHETEVIEKARTSLDEYKSMTNEQFLIFARLFLKDELLGSVALSNWKSKGIIISDIANFFNCIPDELLDFSSDISKRLLLKYIMSNLSFNFSVPLTDSDYNTLYNLIIRLSEIYKIIDKNN